MVADRAYSPAWFECTDRRASLFYFAASVPAVGFDAAGSAAGSSAAAPAKTAKRGEGAPWND